ncbi:MAG: hypothetical protein Phog2KO_44520 [Phototrophicaceae bacterium]
MQRQNAKLPKVKNDDLDAIRSDLLRPFPKLTLNLIITIIITMAVLAWSGAGTEASPEKFLNGVPTLINFVVRLLPPEFEYADGSEYAFTFFPPSAERISPTPKAQRAQRANEAAIEALLDTQILMFVYRQTGADDAVLLTPEEASNYDAEDVHTLRPYIAEEGFDIVLDDWDQSVMIVESGMLVVNAVPYQDGQHVVGKRYVLEPGQWIIGYPIILGAILETIQIAVIGTIASIIVSIPFALLAARNVSPHPMVYQTTRLFLNLTRSIPILIYALIMVSAVGLGPFAGVLALVIGSIGSQAKLFAESFEQIDPNQVAAVRATGAGPIQVFNFAVLPQAFPLLATYSLITFEVNVRASTILGIVGAGGVGFIIQKYTALFQFQRLMGAVIIIAILVTIIDRISDAIRKRII